MSKIIQATVGSVVAFFFLSLGLIQHDTVLVVLASIMIFGAGNLLAIAVLLKTVEKENGYDE